MLRSNFWLNRSSNNKAVINKMLSLITQETSDNDLTSLWDTMRLSHCKPSAVITICVSESTATIKNKQSSLRAWNFHPLLWALFWLVCDLATVLNFEGSRDTIAKSFTPFTPHPCKLKKTWKIVELKERKVKRKKRIKQEEEIMEGNKIWKMITISEFIFFDC